MGPALTNSSAAELLSQDTLLFLKTMRDKAAVLAAPSRLVKAQASLSSHEALSVLQKAAEASALLPELEATRQQLLTAWASVAERELSQLEAELRDRCATRGWRIEGQWPKLIVERGIDVFIDSKKQKIDVGPTRLKDLSAKTVMTALEKLVPGLLPRNFSTHRFLEELAVAHGTCTSVPSDQVEVLRVYRALVIDSQPERFWRDARPSNFLALAMDQFRARFSNLLEIGPLQTTKGHELRIFPPLQPRDAIFVYQAAQQRYGYVGRIAFLKADGDQ